MEFEKNLDILAVTLSRIFHPFIIAVPLGILLLTLADLSFSESVKWVLLSALITILPTVFFMKYHPKYNLRDINSQEDRNLLYLIGLGELISLNLVFQYLKAPKVIMASLSSVIILVPIAALINRYTKISLHVGTLSGFSTALSFLSLKAGILSFTMTAGVAWSRIRINRHTVEQVLLGLIIPSLCVALVFNILL